jgi:SPP1 gp7 family putative phage head morphogenesis protein
MSRNKTDPTGQRRNRNRAIRALHKRLRNARNEVTNLFLSLPYEKLTVSRTQALTNQVRFRYQADAQTMQRLAIQIATQLNIDLQTLSSSMPPEWFFQEFIEIASRSGISEDIRDIEQEIRTLENTGTLVTDTGIGKTTVNIESISQSAVYQRWLNSQYVYNYQIVKTLSQKTANDAFQVIRDGVEAGVNPRTVAREIKKRFDVSKSDAERIARTEINGAYNSSKLDMTDELENAYGIKLGTLHISARLPTTRLTHAERHGRVYTTEQQREWWATKPNRINCFCSTQKVAVDPKGEPLNERLIGRVTTQREEFLEQREKQLENKS